MLRDVERKIAEVSAQSQRNLRLWLARAAKIFEQQRGDKNKLYALHAPEAEWIGKGKARKNV